MASDENLTRSSTPAGVQSIADEDETVVAHEEEQHEERDRQGRGDEGREGEECDGERQSCEERDSEEWENISEKEAREACAEEAVVADKSSGTQADSLLVSGSTTRLQIQLVLTIVSAKGYSQQSWPIQSRLHLRPRLVHPQAVHDIPGKARCRHPMCESPRLQQCSSVRYDSQEAQHRCHPWVPIEGPRPIL